jgi:hypothetical protein
LHGWTGRPFRTTPLPYNGSAIGITFMRSIVVLPLIFALLVSFAATDRRDRIS